MKSGEKRVTIGVLVNQINSYIENLIVKGIYEHLRERDVNLIVFSRSYHSYIEVVSNENTNQYIYQLALSSRLDGIIILSGGVAFLSGEDELKKLIDLFGAVPMVSVNLPMKGIHSINSDNVSGMSELMEHLIKDHGYRRIAFVRGPESNVEAEERYITYIENLAKNGIPVDRRIIFKGGFQGSIAFEAVDGFLKKNECDWDAVVCADDEMLIGVCKALEANGLKVPEDVAVAGFDDIESMETFDPPVTTVRQPFIEMGKKSSDLILDAIEGKENPLLVKMPTQLVIRKSCGCSNGRIRHGKLDMESIQKDPFRYLLSDDFQEFIFKSIDQMVTIHAGIKKGYQGYIKPWAAELEKDLLSGDNHDHTFVFLEDVLSQMAVDQDIVDLWIALFGLMKDAVITIFMGTGYEAKAEMLFRKARHIISNLAYEFSLQQKLFSQKKMWNLRDVNNGISSSVSLSDLVGSISRKVPSLGIRSCYISLYMKEKKNRDSKVDIPVNSKLLLAYDDHGSLIPDEAGSLFPTLAMLPDTVIPKGDHFTWIIQPLCFNKKQFGMIILEFNTRYIEFYSLLQEQISIALNNISLLNEKEVAEEKITAAYHLLKKSEEHFRDMVVLLPTVIIETDLDNRIQFLNQAGMDAFGFNRDTQLKGLLFTDFVDDQDKSRLENYCERIKNGEKNTYHEFQLVKKDGSNISLLNQAAPIYQENKICGIRWCALDIEPFISSAIFPDDTFFNHYKFRPRDKEVLMLMLKGLKIKEIAEKMFISEGTVKFYINAIYSQFGVKNKQEFIEFMKEHQIHRYGYEPFFLSIVSKILKD